MNHYINVFKKYAIFNGRSTRAEYWYFMLFNIIASIALTIVDVVTGSFNEASGMGLLSGIYTLAILIPSIAVTVRRLHDTARSGWWMLILFVPLIGAIIMLVFMIQKSKIENNPY